MTAEPRTDTAAPPEPDLTPAEMVERARVIAPTLVARQAETEERTSYALDTHEEFRRAGFYLLLVPRRYGGYEFDVPTFVRVIMHLARGCPSTAWQVCLPTAHTLLVASWFEERAQDELFAGGEFLCPSVAAPVGRARSTGDGFLELTGTHRYCSGAPYATHYLGQTFPAGADPDGPPAGPPMLFVAPRSEWTMLDDWGHTLGLKGSGSNSIVVDGGRIPEYYALADTVMLDVDNSNGTPGHRLHGNPMFLGRALSFFGLEFSALSVGMVKGALDEYRELITTKTTHRPPVVLRARDPDYQRWYGHARAKVETAEAAMLQAADQWMEACRRQAQDGVHFDVEEDMRINSITRESVRLCWDALQEYVFRTAGSGAAHDGQRMQRVWRDMSMVWGHLASIISDWVARGMAMEDLGIEPEGAGPRNV
jgi:3-hydroxy-9,10-secoandrosta-1,3,5(10)-triene-9,17-dione monooxygenase